MFYRVRIVIRTKRGFIKEISFQGQTEQIVIDKAKEWIKFGNYTEIVSVILREIKDTVVTEQFK